MRDVTLQPTLQSQASRARRASSVPPRERLWLSSFCTAVICGIWKFVKLDALWLWLRPLVFTHVQAHVLLARGPSRFHVSSVLRQAATAVLDSVKARQFQRLRCSAHS